MYKVELSNKIGKWVIVNTELNSIHSTWKTVEEAIIAAKDLRKMIIKKNVKPKLNKILGVKNV